LTKVLEIRIKTLCFYESICKSRDEIDQGTPASTAARTRCLKEGCLRE